MKEKKFDEEDVREMLECLSRGMNKDGHFSEIQAPAEMMLTEEDYKFPREFGIAIS